MDNPKDILLSQWLEGTLTVEQQSALGEIYDLDELDAILSMQQQLTFDGVFAKEDIWANIKNDIVPSASPKSNTSRSRWVYLGLGLAILLAGLYWFFSQQSQVNQTPAGKTEEILFADNTKIILAPLSEVRYDTSEWKKERKIELKGHAYFDVSKGSRFTVTGQQGTVTVMGTQFEIWQSPDQMQVQCTEGSVQVQDENSNSTIIRAGQRVSISYEILGASQGISEGMGFINGILTYDNISPEDIAKEINRFYNIDVVYNLVDKQETYTGVFPLDDLEKAISYIAKTMQWEYEIMPDDKVIFKD